MDRIGSLFAHATARLTPLALAIVLGTGPAPATAQSRVCEAALAELTAFDQAGVGAQSQRLADQLDRATSYYYAAGCDGRESAASGARPAQCGLVEARIAGLRQALARIGDSEAEGARRDRLVADVNRACNGDGADGLSASSGRFGPVDAGSSRVIVDDGGGIRAPDSVQTPLGRAMCVRACDGFYFPLATSPGGREGADAMCQALCPAAPTRAFFLDSGSVDSATNSSGATYRSTPTAYRFRRRLSPTCGCKPAGESWATALKRAEELVGPQSEGLPADDPFAEESKPRLRPGASAIAPRREQAIDPAPRDDGPLEPEFVAPDPSGIAAMEPVQDQREQAKKSPSADNAAPAHPDARQRTVRTVGPPVRYESGPPQAIAPK